MEEILKKSCKKSDDIKCINRSFFIGENLSRVLDKTIPRKWSEVRPGILLFLNPTWNNPLQYLGRFHFYCWFFESRLELSFRNLMQHFSNFNWTIFMKNTPKIIYTDSLKDNSHDNVLCTLVACITFVGLCQGFICFSAFFYALLIVISYDIKLF